MTNNVNDFTTPTEQALTSSHTAVTATMPNFDLPLGDLVHTAVMAASRSRHTQRAYWQSMGQFFVYLLEMWHMSDPLAESQQDGRGDDSAVHWPGGR